MADEWDLAIDMLHFIWAEHWSGPDTSAFPGPQGLSNFTDADEYIVFLKKLKERHHVLSARRSHRPAPAGPPLDPKIRERHLAGFLRHIAGYHFASHLRYGMPF